MALVEEQYYQRFSSAGTIIKSVPNCSLALCNKYTPIHQNRSGIFASRHNISLRRNVDRLASISPGKNKAADAASPREQRRAASEVNSL